MQKGDTNLKEVIIPITSWGRYFKGLVCSSKAINTDDVDALYTKYLVTCANCGTHFSKETLSKLYLFGPDSMFGTIAIVNEDKGETDILAGKCPTCGHPEIKIIKQD